MKFITITTNQNNLISRIFIAFFYYLHPPRLLSCSPSTSPPSKSVPPHKCQYLCSINKISSSKYKFNEIEVDIDEYQRCDTVALTNTVKVGEMTESCTKRFTICFLLLNRMEEIKNLIGDY